MKKIGQQILSSIDQRVINQNNIVWLRVQAPVGTYFYLNDSVCPIYVNSHGVYELNIENMGYINKINFSSSTDFSNELIVDYIYIE